MKLRTIALGLATLLASAAAAQNTTLNVKLGGNTDSTTISTQLINGEDDGAETKAALSGGKATLALDIPDGECRGYYIMVNGKHAGQLVALKAGENATLSATLSRDAAGYVSLDHFTVTGSATDAAYRQTCVDRDALNRQYEAYHTNPAYQEYVKAAEADDTVKMAAITKTDGWKKFNDDETAFFQNLEKVYTAAHKANADNWMGAFMLLTDYSYLTQQQRPEYEALSDAAKNTYYGRIVRDKVIPPSMMGQALPDFTFIDHNTGQTTSLYKVLKNNKYVLLDFWASWCRPCRMEIPNVRAAYEKYHDKGFEVVSISADKKEADWLKALDQEKMPWPQGLDADGATGKLFRVQYYPTTYLIDNQGYAVVKDVRGEALAKKLSVLLD